MNAAVRDRPTGPRFDLSAQRGEARLRLRAPQPMALGVLHDLELVAGEIGTTLDLRAGALAFRDRRTHAVRVALTMDVAVVEQALRALGVVVALHPGSAERGGRCFGATLLAGGSPIDCRARAWLEGDRLVLRLSGFASVLPQPQLAEQAHAALEVGVRASGGRVSALTLALLTGPSEPVGRAADSPGGPGEAPGGRAADDPGRAPPVSTVLSVVSEHALQALLRDTFLTAGWRLPRTSGLCGELVWRGAAGGRGPTLRLVASLDRGAAAGQEGTAALPPQASSLAAARDALAELLAHAPHRPLDGAHAHRLLDAYVSCEPSTLMRAEALLTVADLLGTTELSPPLGETQREAQVAQLGVRALSVAGSAPEVARRVLALALRARGALPDEGLLSAVLASPLPSVQRAALVLEAVPALAQTAPARAERWLERVRPFATDLARLRAAEAALREAGALVAAPPRSLAHQHEREADALARDGHGDAAASAFARAARGYQHARDARAAARCWVACVSTVSSSALALDWVVPGASALQLAGRTQDALALLATLLTRQVGDEQRAAYVQALESAVRFHEALPRALAAPELFAARHRDELEAGGRGR